MPGKNSALFVCYVFLVLARIPELLGLHLGSLHIAMVLLIVLSFACVFAGLGRAVASKPGRFMILCTLWILLGIPFGVWKGGSFQVVTDHWATSFLIFFASASLVESTKSLWRVAAAAFLAMAFLSTLGPTLFGTGGIIGRFNFSVGTLSNANLLGQHLLFGLPFCILIVKRRGLFTAMGLSAAATSLLLIMIVLKTGSRGSFAAMVLMALTALLEVSMADKLKMIVGYLALGAVVIVFTPGGALERYKLIFTSSQESSSPGNSNQAASSAFDQSPDDEIASTAEASSEARRRHLIHSLIVTAAHPIFGVGAGNFKIAAADYAASIGERADWLETHNAYTQLSSETGIPGLTFYLLMIFFATKPLFSIRKRTKDKPELRDIANFASAIRMSILATFTTGLFASLAYEYYFPMISGLSVSFCYVAELAIAESTRRREASVAAPAPSSLVRHPKAPARNLTINPILTAIERIQPDKRLV